MSSASTALAVAPSKIRSKITNDPARRHGRSAEARRVKDLFAGYLATLGNPVDVGTQALILAAAEAVTIAEKARADHLAGCGDDNKVVRLENLADRKLRRLGLNKPASSKPAGPSLQDIRARYANAAVTPAATSEAGR